MELSRESILKDIEGFNQRIAGAKLKLSTLPAEPADWKEKKKVKADSRRLTEEIRHVERIKIYAIEGLRQTDGYEIDTQQADDLPAVEIQKADPCPKNKSAAELKRVCGNNE